MLRDLLLRALSWAYYRLAPEDPDVETGRLLYQSFVARDDGHEATVHVEHTEASRFLAHVMARAVGDSPNFATLTLRSVDAPEGEDGPVYEMTVRRCPGVLPGQRIAELTEAGRAVVERYEDRDTDPHSGFDLDDAVVALRETLDSPNPHE